MHRIIKQSIIILVYLLIFLAISTSVYYSYFRHIPNCYDNIKNQNEEEIDCGGYCIPCELMNIKDIEVIWSKIIPNKTGFYDLAAQIWNPNQNYGTGYLPYTFELYDLQDQLIAQYSGRTFILPNQTKYLLNLRAKNTNKPEFIKLVFGQVEWEKPDDYSSSQLTIQQKQYSFSQVSAILFNESNYDFDKIDIDILLFDASHNLIGINSTEIRALLSWQKRDFIATWFEEVKGQVVFVEIEPETNIFDPSNRLPAKERGIEPFQDY